jgi:hypothetical protein
MEERVVLLVLTNGEVITGKTTHNIEVKILNKKVIKIYGINTTHSSFNIDRPQLKEIFVNPSHIVWFSYIKPEQVKNIDVIKTSNAPTTKVSDFCEVEI